MQILVDASGHPVEENSIMKRGTEMTKLGELSALGQAIWFDYIRRSLITSGEMQALIDQGVRGVTSNPTIFEKAIAGSSDYDEDLKSLVKKGTSLESIYENLALRDIADTADLFRKVYDETKGLDGYVSIEVSPDLAYDTEKTLTEARRLFSLLNRPNIMIKVPATAEGVPAIEALISEGINVNVTLLFGVDRYKETAIAFISGLEKLLSSGKDISRVASVASFFVSRVDTVLDPELEKMGLTNLTGRIAIANAKIAYGLFKEIFSGEKWKRLEQHGALPQRLLWASTGTKNPKYPDTLYIDELIGPQTVNTVPPATLQAFLDHGKMDDKLEQGLSDAASQVKMLEDAGIDLKAVTSRLQEDGVKLFADSFRSLMNSITAKRRELITGKNFMDAELGAMENTITSRLKSMRDNNILARIWDHDHTVWKASPKEISNRLGWLTIPAVMMDNTREIEQFTMDVREAGYSHAYLLGMGGSSLAPEVIRNIFGVRQGYLDLSIVDTTDPGALAAICEGLAPSKSLFIVSTKSGSTVETTSAFKYFYTLMVQALGREKAGEHFIAITDPGSSLTGMTESHNFRKVFLNDPDIGGRYSALSYFGLVPAALMGVDIRSLLDRALVMSENCEASNCPLTGNNHGARLGAILGEAALAGRDKVTFVVSQGFTPFGDWAEQLIAESTGKENKGIVPIVHEHLGFPGQYRNDRIFIHLCLENDEAHDDMLKALKKAGHPVVRINLHDIFDLGSQFFLWEMATAVAGHVLAINPFDQPDVEAAKIHAREAVEQFMKTGSLPALAPVFREKGITVVSDDKADNIQDLLGSFLKNNGKASYVALQAYIAPTPETNLALDSLRMKIRDTFQIATMCGYGPRYLHSTGQLHKGDAGKGLFMQITSSNIKDIPIPDEAGTSTSSMSFGTLKDAQALGDWNALKLHKRPLMRFHIEAEDIPASIEYIREAL